jgi:hypothetical protein
MPSLRTASTMPDASNATRDAGRDETRGLILGR